MNTESLFPQKIDDLVFCQDITISNQEIFDTYQKLLSQKKYEESAQYIKESGILYYGADLFNLLENMIFNTQNYLLQNLKPQLFFETDDDSTIPDGMFGI